MAKEPRSIDGFVLRRREDSPGGRDVQRVFMDAEATKPAKKKIPVLESAPVSKRSPAPPKTTKSAPKEINLKPEDLDDDLAASLQNLGIDKETASSEEAKQDKKSDKKSRRVAKKDKKQLKKAKKSRARRIVKWSLIGLLTLIIAVAGFYAVRFLMAGDKLFQGNILDAFTSKARLQTDANGRSNIIIFGIGDFTWDGTGRDGALLTDSIMVLSIDQDKNDAYMISLPRDLYVKHDCKALGTSAGKLNETFYCAYMDNNQDIDAGAAALQKTAGDILGMDIHYYVQADWTALIRLVDAVGGVDVIIEGSGGNGINDYETGLKLAEGPAHLDGHTALAFARARNSGGGYGLAGGNFDRERNQQKVLVALQKKALSAGTLANPATVNSMLGALEDNLRTSFKSSEVQTLIELARNINSEDIISLPFVDRPDSGPNLMTTGMIGSASVVLPVEGQFKYSDIRAYIKQNLTSDPLTKENALIDVLNGSGEIGLAQRKSDELKDTGFRIGQTTNAPENINESVKIYQLNSEKTATARALQEQFGVQPIVEQLAGHTTSADFVIIFGSSE
ncbi:LCP family protein [Candidatus Saccharibacteria bacterium]|nr:LCP family protein [Candidatus Saccharibacteria bacterium]